MLKFARNQVPRRLLTYTRVNGENLACSASWSHLAPLSSVGSTRLVCEKNIISSKRDPNTLLKSKLHLSSVQNNKIDLLDEAQKRYKHMLTQVNWREVKNSPQPALVYGVAGLIPFVLPPLAILLNGAFLPNLAFAQLAYGASILSFLGGVKWGFAIPESTTHKLTWENLGQSVSLSLAAFGSLLLPPWLGTITLVAGLGASAYIDIISHGYPQWFKAMRFCLSGTAITSLLFMLLLRMLF